MFGFLYSLFLSWLVYKSAVQKPKYCLICSFFYYPLLSFTRKIYNCLPSDLRYYLIPLPRYVRTSCMEAPLTSEMSREASDFNTLHRTLFSHGRTQLVMKIGPPRVPPPRRCAIRGVPYITSTECFDFFTCFHLSVCNKRRYT